MTWFYVCIGIILVIFISLAAIGNYFFSIAIRRSRKNDVSDFAPDDSQAWQDMMTRIKKGSEALKAQPMESVFITSHDGLRLHANIYHAEQPRRILLCFHGYRSSSFHDIGGIAPFYHENGCTLFLIDQRAHGKSEGEYIGFGVLERFDCMKWIRFAEDRFGKEIPIYVSGISMGATTVMMAAGLGLPSSVRGIVADCGFTSPHDIFSDILRKTYKLPDFPVLNAANIVCKVKAHYGFSDASTVESLKKCTIPILFVHGSEDGFVPSEMTERNFSACASPSKRKFIVPGAQHGLSYLVDSEGYQRELSAFFEMAEAQYKAN